MSKLVFVYGFFTERPIPGSSACGLLLAIPKVHLFALLSRGNADAMLFWMLDTLRTVSK